MYTDESTTIQPLFYMYAMHIIIKWIVLYWYIYFTSCWPSTEIFLISQPPSFVIMLHSTKRVHRKSASSSPLLLLLLLHTPLHHNNTLIPWIICKDYMSNSLPFSPFTLSSFFALLKTCCSIVQCQCLIIMMMKLDNTILSRKFYGADFQT